MKLGITFGALAPRIEEQLPESVKTKGGAMTHPYITEEDSKRIEKDCTSHPPKPDQVPRYNLIRDRARTFAFRIVENCPPSRERSLALTHLEEAVMRSNAAISRNE